MLDKVRWQSEKLRHKSQTQRKSVTDENWLWLWLWSVFLGSTLGSKTMTRNTLFFFFLNCCSRFFFVFLKRLVVRKRSITEQLRELWRTKPHFGVKVNILGLPVCFKWQFASKIIMKLLESCEHFSLGPQKYWPCAKTGPNTLIKR